MPSGSGLIEEYRPSGGIPETRVQMEAAASLAGVPFGHEGECQTVERRDLLGAMLVEHVPVGHFHRLGIFEIELLLAVPPLALATFHGNAGGVHMVADLADDAFFLGGLQYVIVLDIGSVRRQIMIVFRRAPTRRSL